MNLTQVDTWHLDTALCDHDDCAVSWWWKVNRKLQDFK